MANQRRGLASESIFQRISTAVQAFLALLFERETWQALARWVFWRVLPKRRRILKLMTELKPLAENALPEMHALRDEVFSKSCLELRQLKDQQVLLDILNHVEQPLGLEQIFFAAVYPVLG